MYWCSSKPIIHYIQLKSFGFLMVWNRNSICWLHERLCACQFSWVFQQLLITLIVPLKRDLEVLFCGWLQSSLGRWTQGEMMGTSYLTLWLFTCVLSHVIPYAIYSHLLGAIVQSSVVESLWSSNLWLMSIMDWMGMNKLKIYIPEKVEVLLDSRKIFGSL